MLGTLIRESWHSSEMAGLFADIQIFEELRLDPYYRRLSKISPDLAPHFNRLIETCRTRRVSLVHGDWSPKNILSFNGRAMAIDFEVIHFGDPSFDAAFLLNHLLLKTFYGIAGAPHLARIFWRTLQAGDAGCAVVRASDARAPWRPAVGAHGWQVTRRVHPRSATEATHPPLRPAIDRGSTEDNRRGLGETCR